MSSANFVFSQMSQAGHEQGSGAANGSVSRLQFPSTDSEHDFFEVSRSPITLLTSRNTKPPDEPLLPDS